MSSEAQPTSLNGMYAAYLEDITPGGFGSAGDGFTPWFKTSEEVKNYVADLKSEAAENEDDDSEDEEGDSSLCIQWIGSFEELCIEMEEQGQIVRLRFYEELEPSLIKKYFGLKYKDLVSETPAMPDDLRSEFSQWLIGGTLDFEC